MNKIETPTLDRMIEIQEKSQICGEFLEFLQYKYAMFELKCKRDDSYFAGIGDYINKEELLAEFFGIDLEEAERERQSILENL